MTAEKGAKTFCLLTPAQMGDLFTTVINYPASADFTLQYDAFNRRTNMVDAVGTTVYTYTAGNQLLTEDGPWAGDTVTTIESKPQRGSKKCHSGGTEAEAQRFTTDGAEISPETHYVYDGWRVIQERNGSNVPQVTYTRGSDLSGSLEGAGGIGGLLARSSGYSSGTGNWSTHNYYFADGNGNITYLVSSSQGLSAKYRYDPFGNTISSSGTLSNLNVYRFSSKEIHSSSGMYYYGYRWYDPSLQRWVNRDPVAELGHRISIGSSLRGALGPGQFTFVENSPTVRIDALGLDVIGGDECLSAPPENGGSKVCDSYGDEKYGGAGLACFCRCAGNSDWAQAVRGCLACLHAKGVDNKLAHEECYAAADKAFGRGSRPDSTLLACWCKCRLKGD